MLHAPRTTHHAPCTMHHAPCTMHHAPWPHPSLPVAGCAGWPVNAGRSSGPSAHPQTPWRAQWWRRTPTQPFTFAFTSKEDTEHPPAFLPPSISVPIKELFLSAQHSFSGHASLCVMPRHRPPRCQEMPLRDPLGWVQGQVSQE